MSAGAPVAERAFDSAAILERLRSGLRVRRSIPPWGRLNLDRPLPFLCVYRRPPDAEDPGTAQLVTGVASYLTAIGERQAHRRLSGLVGDLCAGLATDFGAVLVVEVWARLAENSTAPETVRLITLPETDVMEVIEELESALSRIRLPTVKKLKIECVSRRSVTPPGLLPIPAASFTGALHRIGIEIPSLYADKGTLFPVIHRKLRRGFTVGINRALYRFTRAHTTHRPAHYHSLGSQSLTKAVWEVDSRLAKVSDQFDFLLLATPRNADEAWRGFKRARYEREPRFSYRPRPFDIALAKRDLYAVPIERIEDPAISELFREQQDEIDRKLTMLEDRGTRRFVHESQQLFGGVDDSLLACATDILERIPSRARESGRGPAVDAHAFAACAEKEIAYFRKQHPKVTATVEVRPDLTGLMVSRGRLLVGAGTTVPASRVEALIQHEVGTHILTYFNGMAQPFRQLQVGLPAYEELQEGLAVLAEFLVGGLSRPRLRLLAARVVAVRRMLDGATFVDVFRELDRYWDLASRLAFTTTMRVFRGGGHTKDAVYLRGLMRLLEHLQAGHPLEPFFVGKMGLHHLAFVQELTARKVLVPPPLRPRYLDLPAARERLNRLREGLAVYDLAAPLSAVRKKGKGR